MFTQVDTLSDFLGKCRNRDIFSNLCDEAYSTCSMHPPYMVYQLLDLKVAHKNANTVKQGKSAYFLPILLVVIAVAALATKYK